MAKNVLVLFSGGLDSTFLVYKNLCEGNNVSVAYSQIRNNDFNGIEKQQREVLIDMFEKDKELRGKLKNNIAIIDGYVCSPGNLILEQMPLWLFTALYSNLSGIDEVQIAYCMNDCALSFLNDLQKTWKSFQAFIKVKLPKLTFPLLKYHKHTIYGDLPTKYFNQTVWCERPDLKTFNYGDKIESEIDSQIFNDVSFVFECGECPSCKRMKEITQNKSVRYMPFSGVKSKYALDNIENINYELLIDFRNNFDDISKHLHFSHKLHRLLTSEINDVDSPKNELTFENMGSNNKIRNELNNNIEKNDKRLDTLGVKLGFIPNQQNNIETEKSTDEFFVVGDSFGDGNVEKPIDDMPSHNDGC